MKLHRILTCAALAAMILSTADKASADNHHLSIIPSPNQIQVNNGSFEAAGASFHIDPKICGASREAIVRLAEALSINSGKQSTVTGTGKLSGFIFELDPELADEAYTLQVTRNYARVRASGLNGFLFAGETIRQLLPPEIYGKAAKAETKWSMPCVDIKDAPRFGYRGMHLDVARHFYNVDEVKRYLDIMAFHKMNRFHWHLTDDQGWRIEIKQYPLLTEVGSKRHGTMIRKDWDSCDNIPYGGFYTQEEIKEVIAYAAARGITVIPEIDLPGHMLAALAAYPEYGCTGGPYKVWHRWGVSDEVLCVGKEKSMVFLENILSEIADLFPSEYIHIGGDECPKTRWESCPDCQAKIQELGLKDDSKHTAEHYLQSYVTDRIGAFLATKGKRVIGWDEILEGKLQGDAVVMSWRGVDGGLEAVKLGHDAIMTPNSHFYFDFYQSNDTANEPICIGGYLPVRKCYAFEPFTEEMTEEQKAHILGVQANMWTEYVKSTDHLDYNILPRMSALAEVQWCQPENKDWNRFVDSAQDLCDRFDVMGYNYAVHLFDILPDTRITGDGVEVSLRANKDVPISFQLSTDTISRTYSEPLVIKESCSLTAKAEWGRALPLTLTFNGHLAMGRSYTLNSLPDPMYKTNAENLLTDGVKGTPSFNHRSWGGWKDRNLDVTIDMTGKGPYSQMTLSTNVQKAHWIFNPSEISVSTSKDGKHFHKAAQIRYPAEGRNEPDGMKEYTLRFQETEDRYVRVEAIPLHSLPEWHAGKGTAGYLFVDEIMIR